MIYWLVDNKLSLLVFLGVIALVFGVLRVKTRDRRYTAGVILAGVLIVVVALVPFFFESDRQKIENAIQDMAAGVRANDVNRIFSHVSEEFRHGSMNKKEFRDRGEAAMQRHGVKDAKVWDFQWIEVSHSKRTGVVSFHFKPTGNWEGEIYWRCEAKFKLEADDQWRLVDFELFKPQSEERVPLPF